VVGPLVAAGGRAPTGIFVVTSLLQFIRLVLIMILLNKCNIRSTRATLYFVRLNFER
jgi:hypothetical protein